ncbi:AraC family transcriptional regulator [Alteromonas sp. ASW11-130]|uniref:AraC family transcriptional regulator n=1 Tax=Alteromonas sp. ASW11-130 TaxID=3015775 RepID=UPI002241C749|nr:AraC family transcriptional regulator [Alteromonas sp. ASW11-130]MCW8093461.1 helix-turn-helix transcriptional regulator [Alteromonas sp. ASW11-130]
MSENVATSLKPSVWIKESMILFYGAALDAKKHQHHAIQIVWSTQGALCEWSDGELSGSFIIDSQVEHRLKLTEGWLLLVEPQSTLGLGLRQLLNNSPVSTLSHLVDEYSAPASPISCPFTEISPLFRQLGLPLNFTLDISEITDKRIRKLMEKLNLCFDGECQKPANWRASDVADELYISESHFLHLFSQQVGIAWRPYLRWRRLYCASNAIAQGASATQAAYSAGFSDGAHLSRTFKKMFGLSISEIKTLLSIS